MPATRAIARRFRWYQLYCLLALFELFALTGGLYLSNRIVSNFAASIENIQIWSKRLSAISEISRLAAHVNAPANEVFETKNPGAESERLAAAQQDVVIKIAGLQDELDGLADREMAETLDFDLNAIENAILLIVREFTNDI